ncbi:MAG: hypothetical protein ACI814_004101 [Mariniblastus sp.]|jgi:hypothetical protein
MRIRTGLSNCLALAFVTLFAGTGIAQQSPDRSPAQAEFYRGYFLQHEANDFSSAEKAYRRAIQLKPTADVRSSIDAAMAIVLEENVSSNFAGLMPADSLAFLEISNPAEHAEQIARVMGLVGERSNNASEKVTLQIDDGLSISSDFKISPALFRELKKVRGAAIAITELRDSIPPFEGLVVINPGDSDLLSGLLETGVQLINASDNIGGFPTFNLNGAAWLVKTNRLVIVSNSKDRLKKCVARISDPGQSSLAGVSEFKSAKAKHQDVAVFAYACPKQIVQKYDDLFQGELAIARMVLDLDHLDHVMSVVKATEQGLQTRLNVKFSKDHNSFGYGLIRTVPLTRSALNHIPSESAAVIGMGLNPKMILAAQAAGTQHLSALDIGREFFANIEEIGLFVLPSVTSQDDNIPDFGLVIASSDIEKSSSLWNQVLSLPRMLKIGEGPTMRAINLVGVEAREYTFLGNEVPPLVIARIGDEALIVGTKNAVATALKANKSGTTLATDDRGQAFWKAQSKHTSKAALINVGRCLKLASQMENGLAAGQMQLLAEVIKDLDVTLVIDEAPAEFQIKTEVVGLPLFEDVIKVVAGFQQRAQQHRGDRAVTEHEQQPSPSDRGVSSSEAKSVRAR